MRSVCKTWPARLIATVTALALILASGLGAYSHAAGHAHHSASHAAHFQGVEAHAASLEQAACAHLHGEHERGGTGNGHADCCDTICQVCHGGCAILASACVVPHAVGCAPFVRPTPSIDSAQPSCLERPPRSPALA